MFDLHSRDLTVKIVLGVVLGMVSLGMLLYLVPMPNTPLQTGTDALADVAGQRITVGDVQRRLDLMSQQQQIPQQMRGLYAHQILDQMIFSRLLEMESSRLGIRVSDQDVADEIRQLLPAAFPKGKWIGAQAYTTMVQQQFGLTVSDFEDELRRGLLEEKFRQLVTADVFVTPQDVRQEYLRQNEKVKIDYVQVNPGVLAAKLQPTESELQGWYDAHKSEYQVPEKRSANYLLLDLNLLQKNTVIPDNQLQAYYNAHIDQYKVPERVHVEHILFMTVGKTDAEIAEIRKQAEQVLQAVKHGGDFAKLAKQYSEDPGSKAKGGDLGWIIRGQTVPAFQQAAFSLPVGQVSDLVKTQYGFHIIKVLGREAAHTLSFTEVRGQILQTLLTAQVQKESQQISDNMASIVGQSSRQSLAAVENALGPQAKASLVMGQTPLVSVTQPIPGFGGSNSLRDALFAQGTGQLSLPIDTPQGYLILDVNQIVPTHQGTSAEVHDRVQSDYIQAKSSDEARLEAGNLAAALKQGKPLAQAAKALGLPVQSAEFSRVGSVGNVPARQFLAAFTAPVGQAQGPMQVNSDWYVYAVTAHEEPSEATFETQRSSIRQELLTTAQNNAFDAFRRALENQMKKQGNLTINNANLKQITNPSQT
ncbi:MAG TPA: peptidylprolyl isomerase [Candidatus Dormibacteraeota bacterium]|nr:peptidylprolyl isomerase [Candidatus Dormibacteraeota bacterium]